MKIKKTLITVLLEENRASARESWYQVSIQLTLVTLQKELDRAILEGNV